MGEKTEIAWCDSTFNPVIGCMKVSAGCDNCFAENLMDTRYGRVEWGQRKTDTTAPSIGTRIRTSEANWKLPLRWAKKAREALEDFDTGMLTMRPHRPRVFCASLSDVFDNQWPVGWRTDLFRLIEGTPELDWLLLTKRPENIGKMIDDGGWFRSFPRNVWLGTTCEDQAAYDRRWPILQQFNVRVRFISYEPAIGPLTILNHKKKPDWIICGGESGRGFRPMPLQWAEDVSEECAEHFIPFFMKQLAGLKPIPDDMMIREFPQSKF
jgi:protein gp37